ncbi:MCM-domain-containing protein [Dacryopinax primogenitus]|uniref:DNA replication licensing factor MCM5 n=1 Tax=Dacryopinax primogenitus (strain DJM 731) TaxID=1858805 RepID=M5G119_DACPD|nr:MCM-domain-containing protein [Dacryopinax primogenitus]EJT97477.1 MCM-domain-containing protein [Dacryopinax primogenitus]
MSGFDANRIYAVSGIPGSSASAADGGDTSRSSAAAHNFYEFVMRFRQSNEFKYRDRLRANLLLKNYVLSVSLKDVGIWNEDLLHAIQDRPTEMVPAFETAITRAAHQILYPLDPKASDTIPDCQIILTSEANLFQFRGLSAPTFSKLVRVPGIVIQAAVLSSRATRLHLQCRSCRHVKIIHPSPSLGSSGQDLPRQCESIPPEGQKKDCPLDPYQIIHDKSAFVDCQVIKLQEAPDMVPVGELPRRMLLSVERALAGRLVPGTRVIATGIYSAYTPSGRQKGGEAAAVRNPYLRVLGLEELRAGAAGGGPFGMRFSPQEEEEFGRMSRQRNFYETFAASVAPSIFGNEDIKKAVSCLLFGGSKKILPDGMRLRGDINVLLLGDPGTAKSQLLKFVEKVAPVAVYTSGKGSSAAGLTASVQRDPTTREFYLEGGAMVLADSGVVCIDEFDKMRDEDRVAIHEAMEQQTISIAKAGITTVLNSRTSVLAAANPVFGRYDDMRTPGENIDFQTTILSRFDMIFIVRDEHDEQRDRTIAKHVMNIHMGRTNNEIEGEIDVDTMKRYIAHAKAKCAPRLTPEAAEMLSSHFVSLRKQVQQVERDTNERSSIPITIRQLEAIIRISESLAKMTLSPVVGEHHVDEAIRLFKFSTMSAVEASTSSLDGLSRGEMTDEINRIEKEIRRRLPVGWSTSYQSLVKEFCQGQGYSERALERCLWVLEKREVVRFSGQKKIVHRMGV